MLESWRAYVRSPRAVMLVLVELYLVAELRSGMSTVCSASYPSVSDPCATSRLDEPMGSVVRACVYQTTLA